MSDALQIKEQPNLPLVSFVIPTYNADVQFLRDCIESVLKVELGDDEREVIVVDDGSDNVEELAKHLTDYIPSVRLLKNGHAGVSVSRNKGMDEAVGMYVQFVRTSCYRPAANPIWKPDAHPNQRCFSNRCF